MTSIGDSGTHVPSQRHRGAIRGAIYGLAAAMQFGISAPVSKVLFSDLPPLLLLLFIRRSRSSCGDAVRPVFR